MLAMEGDEGADMGRGVISEFAGASAWVGVLARAPCCELKAPHSGAPVVITNLYAHPWPAPASRAGRLASRRISGINIILTGSLGSTIEPRRFAAVHRPQDSRSERLSVQRSTTFAAARPEPVLGASSLRVDDDEHTTRCVLGAEYAHEYDTLDRRRCVLERRRCERTTRRREQIITSAVITSSRWPRLRAGSAAWALEQQRRKRQSDDDKEKSKKAKAAAAEQGAPLAKMHKTVMVARVQPRKTRAAAAAEAAAAQVAEAAAAADPGDTPCGSPMKWPRPWERPPPAGAQRRTSTGSATEQPATDGSQIAERPTTLRTTTSHFHSSPTPPTL